MKTCRQFVYIGPSSELCNSIEVHIRKLGAPRGQRFPITGICKLRVTWMAQWLTHRAICSHFNSSTHRTRTWCTHRGMYTHTVGRHVDAECSQGVRNLRVVELICSRNVLKCTRKSPLPTNFCLQQLTLPPRNTPCVCEWQISYGLAWIKSVHIWWILLFFLEYLIKLQ